MSDQQEVAAAAVPDYTKLSEVELLDALGNDPEKWAKAFAQQATVITGGHVTHGFVRDWMAKALGVDAPATAADGAPVEKPRGWFRSLFGGSTNPEAKNLAGWDDDLTAREDRLHADNKAFDARVAAFEDAQKAASAAKVDHPPSDPASD